MTDEDETEIEDLNIPADAAALVLYADGSVAMHLPKGGDDTDVPFHALSVVTFGSLYSREPQTVDEMIERFMSGDIGSRETH